MPKALREGRVVGQRAVPQRAIRGPLHRRGLGPRVGLRPGHEFAAGCGADHRQRGQRVRIARGVHQPEKATPADAEHVDPSETERLAHTLDVSDELILRALLDGHPLGTTVAAMVVDDQAKPERGRRAGPGCAAVRMSRSRGRRADRGTADRSPTVSRKSLVPLTLSSTVASDSFPPGPSRGRAGGRASRRRRG